MNFHACIESIKTSPVNSTKTPEHEGIKKMTIFSDWGDGPR